MQYNDIINGKNGSYKIGRYIGGGGNGVVYEAVNVVDKSIVAVKVLRGNHVKRGNKRYERFANEISKMNELSKSIKNLMPILDYHIPSRLDKNNPPWYVMPKAELLSSYIEENSLNTNQKIKLMLDLAEIIENLHALEHAHRDIKPDNIFIYKNNITLGDFGLVWDENSNIKTADGEIVGPKQIIPPEMLNGGDPNAPKSAADVYLFAKTLWIFITNKKNGFGGAYKIGEYGIELNERDYSDTVSFSNIHILLEKATIFNPFDRITISNCKEYIEMWLEGIEPDIIKHHVACERMEKSFKIGEMRFNTFSEITKGIDIILSSKISGSNSMFSSIIKKYDVSVIPECIEFYIIINRTSYKYLVNPTSFILKKGIASCNYNLETKAISEDMISIYIKAPYVKLSQIKPWLIPTDCKIIICDVNDTFEFEFPENASIKEVV